MVDKKKAKSKDVKGKDKKSKKCKSCSLDCSIIRADALGTVSVSEKKERNIALFGSEKAKYTKETCPKK